MHTNPGIWSIWSLQSWTINENYNRNSKNSVELCSRRVNGITRWRTDYDQMSGKRTNDRSIWFRKGKLLYSCLCLRVDLLLLFVLLRSLFFSQVTPSSSSDFKNITSWVLRILLSKVILKVCFTSKPISHFFFQSLVIELFFRGARQYAASSVSALPSSITDSASE